MTLAVMPLGVASAQTNIDSRVLETISNASGSKSTTASLAAGVVYSNYSTFVGAILNTGATNNGGNIVTKLVADDITPVAGSGGWITEIKYAIRNDNTVPVRARVLLRFWADFPVPGFPGNYYRGNMTSTPVFFNIAPQTFTESATSLVTATIPVGDLAVPAGTFWVGFTFDNDEGGTGATLAQMDKLGPAIADGPAVGEGSSANRAFRTSTAGSFIDVSPLVGDLLLDGSPAFNVALELKSDGNTTPSTKSTWGRVKQLYR